MWVEYCIAGLVLGAGGLTLWARARKRRRFDVQARAFEDYFANMDKNRWDL